MTTTEPLAIGRQDPLREELGRAVLRDEAARRVDEEGRPAPAGELWSALGDGRSVLVDCFVRGPHRYYLVLPRRDLGRVLGALRRRDGEVLGGLLPSGGAE